MERLSIKSDVEKEVNAKQLDADTQRLRNLESILLKLYDEQADLNARWQAERQAVLGVNELQEKIAMTQLEIETAEREYDLNKAAELKYGTLSELEEQLQAAQTKEDQAEEGASDVGDSMLRDEVVPDDIGQFFFSRAAPSVVLRARALRERNKRTPAFLTRPFLFLLQPASSPCGPAYPRPNWWRPNGDACSPWPTSCASASWGRTRRLKSSRTPSKGRGPG